MQITHEKTRTYTYIYCIHYFVLFYVLSSLILIQKIIGYQTVTLQLRFADDQITQKAGYENIGLIKMITVTWDLVRTLGRNRRSSYQNCAGICRENIVMN